MIKNLNFQRENIAKKINYLSNFLILAYCSYGISLEYKIQVPPLLHYKYRFLFFLFIFILYLLVNLLDPSFEKNRYCISRKWKLFSRISEFIALVFSSLLFILFLYTTNAFLKLIALPLHIILGVYSIFSDIIITRLYVQQQQLKNQ